VADENVPGETSTVRPKHLRRDANPANFQTQASEARTGTDPASPKDVLPDSERTRPNDRAAEPLEFDFATYLSRRLEAGPDELARALGAVLLGAEADRHRVRAEAAATLHAERSRLDAKPPLPLTRPPRDWSRLRRG
jgi:hypothetical protein